MGPEELGWHRTRAQWRSALDGGTRVRRVTASAQGPSNSYAGADCFNQCESQMGASPSAG